MSYKVIDVDSKNKVCYIEYNGKNYSFHYDYYSGRFIGDDDDIEYFFPDIPGGGWIGKSFKYKTFREQVTSEEFMQAVMTEMEPGGRLRRR